MNHWLSSRYQVYEMCIRDRLIVGAVVVQQVLFTAGYQLGGEQAGQQVQGYAVFNHAEELAV